MVLHRFRVVTQVEVGIAELAVDGTECSKVVRAGLDGGLKEGHTRPTVAGFAQPFAFQCQLEAHRRSIVVLIAGKIFRAC